MHSDTTSTTDRAASGSSPCPAWLAFPRRIVGRSEARLSGVPFSFHWHEPFDAAVSGQERRIDLSVAIADLEKDVANDLAVGEHDFGEHSDWRPRTGRIEGDGYGLAGSQHIPAPALPGHRADVADFEGPVHEFAVGVLYDATC